jgi:uncharacterized protein (UPF0248 family)
MIPIQDLLHRIQWDPGFGNATFVIGYYDRIDDRIVRVPFQHVNLPRGEHFSFDVVEEDGTTHMVPFHRVREVWRNDKLIWQRKGS